MGTPFISLLEPTQALVAYDRTKPHTEQAPGIPQTFLDAMEVRQAVFVEEQGVPLEFEVDEDDPRSCHWVVYASVNQTDAPEVRHAATGEVVQPRRSSTRSTPIGTVRLVPFPHPPHPAPGGRYEDGRLVGGAGPLAAAAQQPSGADRPTGMHDGREPYVKLGRLAVVKEFRGHKVARLLVGTALAWMRGHADYFNPSVAQLGFDQLAIERASDIPKWAGLVGCHAQDGAVGAWVKSGFVVDEGMGTWWEEGIPHVGMFQRLPLEEAGP